MISVISYYICMYIILSIQLKKRKKGMECIIPYADHSSDKETDDEPVKEHEDREKEDSKEDDDGDEEINIKDEDENKNEGETEVNSEEEDNEDKNDDAPVESKQTKGKSNKNNTQRVWNTSAAQLMTRRKHRKHETCIH